MDYNLAVNLSKLKFHIKEIVFLGHVINDSKVKIDAVKMKTIEEWAVA